MWSGISVCAFRIGEKFSFSKIMTALFSVWLIVSVDLLLYIVVIRLDGGFWIWDARPINLEINHHMFLSVVRVNYLGYMFEVPSVIYLTLKSWEKDKEENEIKIIRSIFIGFSGICFVGICSYISLLLNEFSDEWFSYCLSYNMDFCTYKISIFY